MQAAQIPARFPIPFADGATAGFIRPIPEASQIGIEAGAASLVDGFPPVTFTPVAAGGTPPFGQDFNGLLNQITLWNQWQSAGGPVKWDSTFSTSIGGYPKGAIVAAAVFGNYWMSIVDDNTTNPDASGANWTSFSPLAQANYAVDTGTVNALVVTLDPAPPTLASLVGKPIFVKVALTNTNNAPTIAVNGFAATTIVNPNQSALGIGQLAINSVVMLTYDGTRFQLTAGGTLLGAVQPTQTILTGGTGTYTVPAGAVRLFIRMVGGGAGGGGTGTPTGVVGTAGGNTSFGTVVANGGAGGQPGNVTSVGGSILGGAGGAAGTAGTGTASVRITGNAGEYGGTAPNATSGAASGGGFGGGAPFFVGAGRGGKLYDVSIQAGFPAPPNTGGGGGGAAPQALNGYSGGGGGGPGEYVEINIGAPVASYSYGVGAGGAGGPAGTNGRVGGAGATGCIIITEYYA